MTLEEIRKQIDAIDEQIVTLLARRFALARKSAQEKLQNRHPIKNKTREGEVLQSVQKKAAQAGMSTMFITSMYKKIINESIQIQKQK